VRRACAALVALAAALTQAGCAIRYDHAGVSRTGVFLWGLGDPPGVDWNLDWPRREVPELPPAARRDALPPRAGDANLPAPPRSFPIPDDARDRDLRRAPDAADPVAARAGDRGDGGARR
jgi:hypothetical protein